MSNGHPERENPTSESQSIRKCMRLALHPLNLPLTFQAEMVVGGSRSSAKKAAGRSGRKGKRQHLASGNDDFLALVKSGKQSEPELYLTGFSIAGD